MATGLGGFTRIWTASAMSVLVASAHAAPALAAATVATAAASAADPSVAARAEALRVIDVWLDAQQAYDRIPALSAAVVQGDQIVWSRGYGFVDAEHQVPATGQTLYSICSISKLFTAVALMQQWEAGRVSLDAPVTRYLPWATLASSAGTAGAQDSVPITLRGLLTHSAGLPRESDFPYWSAPDFPFPTQAQVRETYPRQAPLFPASRWYQYSNLGLTLVGETVEAVADESYGAYVQAHILDPLALKDTQTVLPVDLLGTRLAVAWGPLDRDGRRPRLPAFDARGIQSAAGLTSTAEDLGRFAAWQFRLLRTGQEEVLRASTLREMQRVHFTSPDWQTTRGLGFGVRKRGTQTYVGHTGGCPGYQTNVTLRPATETAAVVMITGVENVSAYVDKVFDLLDKRNGFAFETPAAIDLTPYVGRYQDGVWASETVVMPWAGGLAAFDLPTADPASAMVFLKPQGENRFVALRDDGSESDAVRFERGPDGQVTSMVRFSSPTARVGGI